MTNEELVLLIQKTDDKRSHLEELYMKNAGMIHELANRYKGYMDIDDLCQEGFLGLVKAAYAWTEEGGARFTTYARYWVTSYMQRYIENNGNMIRLPAGLQGQIMKLKRVVEDFYKTKARKPTISEIALKMQLSERQVKKIIDDAMLLEIRSASEILFSGDEPFSLEETFKDPADHIGEVEAAIQNEQLKAVLWEIVDSLDADQAKVIHEKYQNSYDAEQMAIMMGTTAKAVKTLENKAFRELRRPKNAKKLRPFMSNSRIFSISTSSTGLSCFNITWTSSTERAALMAES